MPDLRVVLGTVRDRLAALADRREQIQAELATVEREYQRVAAAISVMAEHAETSSQASSSDPQADQPLTERILDALRSSASSRADLRRVFQPLGVGDNTLDSALNRLRKRGAVERRGRRIVPVQGAVQDAASVSSPPSPEGGSDVDQHGADPPAVTVEVEPVESGLQPAVAVPEDSGGMASDRLPGRPLTVRVLEAVATSIATSRAALVRHFGAKGITEGAVDAAIAGLRKRRKLERRAGGVLAVSGADAGLGPANAASQGSSQGS